MGLRHSSVLLLGPTSAGKTPLGEMIGNQGLGDRKCLHFDFGCELRRIAAGSDPRFTPDEVTFIRSVLSEGLLLEDEHFPLAKKILGAFAEMKRVDRRDVIVLNGLPRHRGQAELMNEFVDMRLLVVLQCSPADIFARIRNNSGGDRGDRVDDIEELVEKKLEIYNARTAPLVDYYRLQGVDIIRLSVGPFSETGALYRKLLNLLRGAPVSL